VNDLFLRTSRWRSIYRDQRGLARCFWK